MLEENNPYRQQVALLLEVLPLVGREHCFALKGGTAINLFVRDMPRLSVVTGCHVIHLKSSNVKVKGCALLRQPLLTDR